MTMGVSDHPYFIAQISTQLLPQIVIKEKRLYSRALLLGVVLLLAGLGIHSWKLIAVGALVAGAGGWFGMLATGKKS
jgi:hypothetical protein